MIYLAQTGNYQICSRCGSVCRPGHGVNMPKLSACSNCFGLKKYNP